MIPAWAVEQRKWYQVLLGIRARPCKLNISRKICIKRQVPGPYPLGILLWGRAGRDEPVVSANPSSDVALETVSFKGCVGPSFTPEWQLFVFFYIF